MGILILLWDAIEEFARHNFAMEEQARRAQLTPAQRKAEDDKSSADSDLQIVLFVIGTLGFGVAFLILVSLRG